MTWEKHFAKKYTVVASKTYFHVTDKKNVNTIMTQGLEPRVGHFSKLLGESEPAVFLFTSEQAAEDALSGWLGEEYGTLAEELGREIPLKLLKVVLPDDFEVQEPDGNQFEAVVFETIPPDCIHPLKDL